MRLFKNDKKSGFTLMEIAIAVLIVSILLLTCVPIVKDQLKKSDEYSYYLAFKTVEKLGGQIAALGDSFEPDYNVLKEPSVKVASKNPGVIDKCTKTLKNKINVYFAVLGIRLANSEEFLFKRLFPKTLAASTKTEEVYDSEIYNSYSILLQYCAGHDVIDPTGKQDYILQECFDPGSCYNRKKCDENKSNCCSTTLLNLKDTPGCDASWTFKQTYKRKTTVKTLIECEKDEEGKKVDSSCTDRWETSTSWDYDLDSCSTYSSDPNTTYTCSKYNSQQWVNVGHILKEKDVRDAIAAGEGLAYCPSDLHDEAELAVFGFFGHENCKNGSVDYATGQSTQLDYPVSEIVDEMENGLTGPAFCSGRIAQYCTEEDDEGRTYRTTGNCSLIITTSDTPNTTVTTETWTRPTVTNTCTEAYGYYNMQNVGGNYNVVCQCSNSYPQVSENNDKVCCKAPTDSTQKMYAVSNLQSGANACVACSGDFNTVTSSCCPEHSVFNGAECECVEGFTMEGNYCKRTSCAKGSHYDEKNEVCVNNPPIVKAENFCKTIEKDWNTESANCSTFTEKDGVKYYPGVYNAAKGTGTGNDYLSILSQKSKVDGVDIGPFHKSKGLTPNIVLANGLKLWILGDKAASIPGLSYTPVAATEIQNMCKPYKNKTSAADCTAADSNAYFCSAEKHCYTMDAASLAKMGDARNCCASTDLNNLATASPDYEKDNRAFAVSGFTVFVDINADKGPGALWEDVFPFFVGSNGTVYPAYPLDAPKSAESEANSLYLGGNSVSNLAVDVYYYDTDSSNKVRKKVIAYPAVSYARGVCSAKLISQYTPYCMNLGEKYKDPNGTTNPCDTHRCFVAVRNKLRLF